MTKPVDLDALDAAQAVATPGEWEVRIPFPKFPDLAADVWVDPDGPNLQHVVKIERNATATATAIAALHNAYPAMAAEIRALREVAEAAESACRELRRKDAAERDALAAEVATLRDRVDGLEIDLNSAVQNSKANEVEANNLRSANRTLRARVAELEAIAREAESQANDMVSQKIAALGVAVNGAADFVMTKFRERLARIEAASPPAPQGQASPWLNQLSNEFVEFWDAVNAFAVASGGRADAVNTARMNAVVRINAAVKALLVGTPNEAAAAPQGQPVATDEEVVAVFVAAERDALVTHRMGCAAADRYGALAVARHVRAERPTCLVERAVALGCDVRVCEDVAGWLVAIHESSDLDEDVHRDVAASDVPATLARLLDEVEAARKAVQR